MERSKDASARGSGGQSFSFSHLFPVYPMMRFLSQKQAYEINVATIA
jgi:hypothetical protein